MENNISSFSQMGSFFNYYLNINYIKEENTSHNNSEIISDIWKKIFSYIDFVDLLSLKGINACTHNLILGVIDEKLLEWKENRPIFNDLKIDKRVSAFDIKYNRIIITVGDRYRLLNTSNNEELAQEFDSKNEAKSITIVKENTFTVQCQFKNIIGIEVGNNFGRSEKRRFPMADFENQLVHSNANKNGLFVSISDDPENPNLYVYDSLAQVQTVINLQCEGKSLNKYVQLALSENFVYITYENDGTYYLQEYSLHDSALLKTIASKSEMSKILLGNGLVILSIKQGEIAVLEAGGLKEKFVFTPRHISKENMFVCVDTLLIDGHHLYLQSSNGVLEIWDTAKGEYQRTINLPRVIEKKKSNNNMPKVNSIVVTEKCIFIAYQEQNEIEIWNKQNGFYIATVPAKECPKEIKFDGNQLVARFEKSPWIQRWTIDI